MNLLLDTCTLMWAWGHPDRLSRRLQTLLRDPHNQIRVSAASAWELATKHRVVTAPRSLRVASDTDAPGTA